MKSIKELERKLHQIIQPKLLEGYYLVSGERGPSNEFGGCCLVGILNKDSSWMYMDKNRGEVARLFKITTDEWNLIEDGFEKRLSWPSKQREVDLLDLGCRLREHYNA